MSRTRTRSTLRHLRRNAVAYAALVGVVTLSPLPSVASTLVGTADLKDGAVTRPKIADNAVGTTKIADGSVTTWDVLNGTIRSSDVGRDVRTHWAWVRPDGSVGRSSGGVSATHPQDSLYEVTFPEDVSRCAYVATAGNGAPGVPGSFGLVSVWPSTDPHSVSLSIANSQVTGYLSIGFFLLVDC